ncbi:hypothetical protein GCM10010440_01180 [Kitasatospora cinereorecta]
MLLPATPASAARNGPTRVGARLRGVPWKTTEDIPHTGTSVDVALGHDMVPTDRTGGPP